LNFYFLSLKNNNSTPFLEFSQLAGYLLYEDDDVPAAGLITGIGQIEG